MLNVQISHILKALFLLTGLYAWIGIAFFVMTKRNVNAKNRSIVWIASLKLSLKSVKPFAKNSGNELLFLRLISPTNVFLLAHNNNNNEKNARIYSEQLFCFAESVEITTVFLFLTKRFDTCTFLFICHTNERTHAATPNCFQRLRLHVRTVP